MNESVIRLCQYLQLLIGRLHMKYERPSKKAIGCMYVASGILDILILVITIAVWSTEGAHGVLWITLVYYVILVACLFDLLIAPYIRYCRYQYCITDEAIDVKEGFLFVKRNIVPIERLHKIRTVRGPIDRIFGVTKVIVTTAGGDVTIRFLEEQQADQIACNLSKRINEISSQQRTEQPKDIQEG